MTWKLIALWIFSGFAALALAQQPVQQPAEQPGPPAPNFVFKIDLSLGSLSWSPNSQFLAVGGRGKIWILRAPTFEIDRTLNGEQEDVSGLEWSPDGTLLASGGKDGTLQIWSGDALQRKLFQGGWILDLAWNSDGSSIMAVDYTGLAKEWDVQGFLRASIQLDGDGLGVDWSPKGRYFAVTTGQDGSRLLLFDEQSGQLRWRRRDVASDYKPPFGYGLDEVNCVRYSPSGSLLATAHQDGRILVSSASTGERLMAVQLYTAGIGGARHVAWSPGGEWLASCGEDGRVFCIDYPKAKQRIQLINADKPIWSVGWSPDGKWLAAVGEEGRVWIWSTSDFLPVSAPRKPAGESAGHSSHARSSPTPTRRSHRKLSPLDWIRRHL